MVSGVSIELHDGSNLHLVGRASVLLADSPAIKECIQCKGHTGMICCPRCMNATQHKSKDSIPMHLLTDKVVSIANFNIKAFKKLTNEDLRKIT